MMPCQARDVRWADPVVLYVRSLSQLYARPADGSRPETPLTTGGTNDIPLSWSPDGRTLAFARMSQATGYDIWTL